MAAVKRRRKPSRGATTSAHVGMSNEMGGANPPHRTPQGSAARALRGGLVGPKARARAVADGHQVDTPGHDHERLDVTEMLIGMRRRETSPVHAGREVVLANPHHR